MAEHDEQRALVEYLEAVGAVYYAIPNGGYRTKAEAAKLKAEGVRKGVPDLCVPIARGGYHSLYIEMKRTDGVASDVSDEQYKWVMSLREQGMAAFACFGVDNAIACVDWYMGLDSDV